VHNCIQFHREFIILYMIIQVEISIAEAINYFNKPDKYLKNFFECLILCYLCDTLARIEPESISLITILANTKRVLAFNDWRLREPVAQLKFHGLSLKGSDFHCGSSMRSYHQIMWRCESKEDRAIPFHDDR